MPPPVHFSSGRTRRVHSSAPGSSSPAWGVCAPLAGRSLEPAHQQRGQLVRPQEGGGSTALRRQQEEGARRLQAGEGEERTEGRLPDRAGGIGERPVRGELLRCAALVIHRTRRRFPGPLPGPLGGGCRLNLTPGEFPKEVNRGVSNQRRGTGEAARLPKRCCLYISRFTGGFGGGCTGWRGRWAVAILSRRGGVREELASVNGVLGDVPKARAMYAFLDELLRQKFGFPDARFGLLSFLSLASCPIFQAEERTGRAWKQEVWAQNAAGQPWSPSLGVGGGTLFLSA